MATKTPTVTITSSLSKLKIGQTATITAKFSDIPTGFTLDDFQSPAGVFSNLKQNGKVYTATFTPAPLSTATSADISIAAGGYTNALGTLGAASRKLTVSMDMIAPTVLISGDINNLTMGQSTKLTITFSESPKGFAIGDLKSTTGVFSGLKGSGSVYTVTYKATKSQADINIPEGSYTDSAGNTGVAGKLALPISPNVTLSSNVSALKIGEISTVTATFNKAPVGFTIEDLISSSGQFSNFLAVDSTHYAATFTPTSGSTDTASLIRVGKNSYSDAQGNMNNAETNLTLKIDMLAPTVKLTSDKAIMTSNDTAVITATFSEIPQGLDISDFNSAQGSFSHLTVSNTDQKIYTVNFQPNDLSATTSTTTSTITLAKTSYTDPAGNVGGSDTINIVTTVPIDSYVLKTNADGSQTETYDFIQDGHHIISTYNYDTNNVFKSSTEIETWVDNLQVPHSSQTNYMLTINSDGTKTELYTLNNDGVLTSTQYEEITKNKINTTPFDAQVRDIEFTIMESTSYTFNIDNFGVGDSLFFINDAITPTITNTSTTDKSLDVIYSDNSIVTTIHLTGITSVQDAAINSYDSFLKIFA